MAATILLLQLLIRYLISIVLHTIEIVRTDTIFHCISVDGYRNRFYYHNKEFDLYFDFPALDFFLSKELKENFSSKVFLKFFKLITKVNKMAEVLQKDAKKIFTQFHY